MVTTVYRLHRKKHPAHTGVGAALYGGRWNPKGVEVIYASGSRALAAMEILVHSDAQLPVDYVCTAVRIPDQIVIRELKPAGLAAGWESDLAYTQRLGSEWAEKKQSAVLRVPSVVVPDEWNYLLNPAHPEFRRLKFLAPTPFPFDPRLRSGG